MKILFVNKQILFPRDTGGKICALNVLRHLAQWHEVTYVCNLRPGEDQYLTEMHALGLRLETVPGATPPWGGTRFYAEAALNLVSSRPYSVNRNFDPELRAKVAECLAGTPYDLLICNGVQLARHTVGLPATAKILFQHNVEAQILQRHAEVSGNSLMRLYMRSEWRKMRRFEGDLGGHFDAIISVSERDRATFEADYSWNHVRSFDTGVDTDYFRNESKEESEDRVTFIGSMDWLPNQDGAAHFVREIWPRIRQARPNAVFRIVGRNPPARITALSDVPGVEVVGGVPDVRPWLSQSTVVVVPLLVGGGTRLKIYEAMAMRRALVSTTIGAEGLPVIPGKHFLRADSPEAFAAAVVQLLADSALRTEIGDASDSFVRENFGTESIARQFESICMATWKNRRDRLAERSPGAT